MFPPGSALLLAPVQGLLETVGLPVLDGQGHYNARREAKFQHYVASIAMAALVALCFLHARRFLELRRSLLLAAAVAFSVPIWSVGAASLWSHAFALLLLAAALYLLDVGEERTSPLQQLVLGTLLSFMFFVRPTMAISIVAITILVVRRQCWGALPLLASGTAWFSLFVMFSFAVFDTWLPPYFTPDRVLAWPAPVALAGHLISPGRGLFIYVPALLYLFHATAHTFGQLERRDLIAAGIAVSMLHWLQVSSFGHWWGGHAYGPRLMMDVIPWWVLMAIRSEQVFAGTEQAPPRPLWLHSRLLYLLLAVGIAQAAIGSMSWEARNWNGQVQVDEHPEALWDWHNAPFLMRR